MKAVLFTEREAASLAELPCPRPGPGEVLIEVRASGICHTDIEILRGNYGTSAFPLIPGHEYAGVVAEVDPGVQDLAPGDRVVVDPNIECGTCRACRRGWAHLCATLEAYGVTRNGGFAETSIVRADHLHLIGEMPFEIAALAEPVGCVLNGLDAVRAERAHNTLIFGAGPMGVLLAIGLRMRGVADITLADIDPDRLDLAESFGFRAIASAETDLAPWRQGTDLAIDATGIPAVAGHLLRYIADGGAGLFFGVCPQEALIELAPFEVFRRQITLAGSHSLNHNIPDALATLDAFGPDIGRIVSHRLPLAEIARLFAERPPRGSLKIQTALD